MLMNPNNHKIRQRYNDGNSQIKIKYYTFVHTKVYTVIIFILSLLLHVTAKYFLQNTLYRDVKVLTLQGRVATY